MKKLDVDAQVCSKTDSWSFFSSEMAEKPGGSVGIRGPKNIVSVTYLNKLIL